MKGDREKCIEAGAWDYLSKPWTPSSYLSVLRAWLHRLMVTSGAVSSRQPDRTNRDTVPPKTMASDHDHG